MQVLVIIFFIAIAAQITYFIVFTLVLSKKRLQTPSQQYPVSVVVCAHDEEENLKELIPLLLNQEYPDFEVIIVDDRSNDQTFDLLLAETKKDRRLKMVHVNRTPPHVNSKKFSITLGIKAAKYEWILLTDADCRPGDNRWIDSMSSHFNEQTNFVLGYSPYSKKSGLLNSFIRFESLVTAIQFISFALLGSPYMGVGRNMAYRRSMFLQVKGFNTFLNVIGGDDDLFVNQHATANNTAVAVGKPALVYSNPKTTWRDFMRQKIRHFSVGKFYRFKHRLWLGIFAFTWLTTWFLGIPLSFLTDFTYWVFGGLILRVILLMIATAVSGKSFGERFEIWKVPFLDFLYSFYYLTTGLITLGTKKVRWKN